MTALRLGILFSTSGDYGALGRDCRDGGNVTDSETVPGVNGQAQLPAKPRGLSEGGELGVMPLAAGDPRVGVAPGV